MGQTGDFYIAWDGRRYEGIPPPGWFLAADNRWWPTPDIIGDRPGTATESVHDIQAELDEPPRPTAPHDPAPLEAPYSPPQPTSGPPSRPSFQLGRKGVRWIGQVLFFLFVFRGCLGVPDFNSGPEATEAAEAAVPEPSATFQLASPVDYEVNIDLCSGNAPTGEILNKTDTRLRFNVVLVVTTATGQSELWSSVPTLPADPGEAIRWRAPMPDESGLAVSCSVDFVESKPVQEDS